MTKLVLHKPEWVTIEHDEDTGDLDISIQPERRRWWSRKPIEVFTIHAYNPLTDRIKQMRRRL